MLRIQRLAAILASLSVAAFFGCLTFQVESHPNIVAHLDGVLTRFEGIETKANATLINVDKGTAVWANSAKEQTGAIEDLATDAHGTLSQANAALFSINDSAHSLNEDLGALHETIDAGTETARQASLDLRTLDTSFDSLQPLISDSDRALASFNALLARKSLAQAIDSAAETSTSVAAISADFHYWSHPFFHPEPCTTKGCKWKRGLEKTGGYLGIIGSAATSKTLFTPLPVKVQK